MPPREPTGNNSVEFFWKRSKEISATKAGFDVTKTDLLVPA
jgi:hypothetical protein